MNVSGLLEGKDGEGDEVITVGPDDTVAAVAGLLAEHRIGAVVVSADGSAIDGVLSERDIVRALAAQGAAALEDTASEIMTRKVFTCQPETTVDQVMALMTERRIRHLPVVVDEKLIGIISIGDVVKDRISALETETQALHEYIAHGR